jgi:hypothetical protein
MRAGDFAVKPVMPPSPFPDGPRRPGRNDDYEEYDEDDYEDHSNAREPRRRKLATRSSSRGPRRGKPTSFLRRICQAVPRVGSDGTWAGSYFADPLIRIPYDVCFLTILLDLFATLAVKVGMSKIGLIVIGIYIMGAVITFGLAMVSGFAIMIKLCGGPNVLNVKLFLSPAIRFSVSSSTGRNSEHCSFFNAACV